MRLALRLPVIALSSTACLVAPNPEFIDPLVDDDETDTGDIEQCPAGLANCDGEPGCEASLDDPATCGSCVKRCELGGQMLECVEGLCVGELSFTDLPDVHVDGEQPDQNFGFAPALLVDAERTAYIELPNLGPLPTGATVHSLALHLTCTDSGTSLDVYRVENPWDESAMTHNNAPGLGSSRILTFSPQLGDNALELVGLLPSWRIGNPKRSLGFGPTSSAGPSPDSVDFSSREGSAPPYLVLDISW